jgi:glycosyltransferase involved in cell wall biosynthesis
LRIGKGRVDGGYGLARVAAADAGLRLPRAVPARRRLLVLASYPPSIASTRFRACVYFDALAARGIDCDLRPFLNEAAVRRLYAPGGTLGKAAGLATGVLRHLALLLAAGRYDGVLVQREAALVGPALLEATLAQGRRLPLVFDFDDAIWLEDGTNSPNRWAARLLKAPGKTRTLVALAREVVVATEYLAGYARAQGAARVTVVPTVVSRVAWTPRPGRLDGAFASPSDEPPTLGWVGTHTTARALDGIVPALQALWREGHRFRVRLVGAARTLPLDGVPVESVPWRAETEVEDFRRLDLGLAPMPDTPWARGKGGFKQVQYMAVGVPMVSSPQGGAREFVEDGVHGLFATTPDEWTAQLRRLLLDRALRARLARAGRDLVETRLSTEAQAPRLVEVVERALFGAGRHGEPNLQVFETKPKPPPAPPPAAP